MTLGDYVKKTQSELDAKRTSEELFKKHAEYLQQSLDAYFQAQDFFLQTKPFSEQNSTSLTYKNAAIGKQIICQINFLTTPNFELVFSLDSTKEGVLNSYEVEGGLKFKIKKHTAIGVLLPRRGVPLPPKELSLEEAMNSIFSK